MIPFESFDNQHCSFMRQLKYSDYSTATEKKRIVKNRTENVMKKQVLFFVRFRIQGKKKQKIDFMSANNKSISAKK